MRLPSGLEPNLYSFLRDVKKEIDALKLGYPSSPSYTAGRVLSSGGVLTSSTTIEDTVTVPTEFDRLTSTAHSYTFVLSDDATNMTLTGDTGDLYFDQTTGDQFWFGSGGTYYSETIHELDLFNITPLGNPLALSGRHTVHGNTNTYIGSVKFSTMGSTDDSAIIVWDSSLGTRPLQGLYALAVPGTQIPYFWASGPGETGWTSGYQMEVGDGTQVLFGVTTDGNIRTIGHSAFGADATISDFYLQWIDETLNSNDFGGIQSTIAGTYSSMEMTHTNAFGDDTDVVGGYYEGIIGANSNRDKDSGYGYGGRFFGIYNSPNNNLEVGIEPGGGASGGQFSAILGPNTGDIKSLLGGSFILSISGTNPGQVINALGAECGPWNALDSSATIINLTGVAINDLNPNGATVTNICGLAIVSPPTAGGGGGYTESYGIDLGWNSRVRDDTSWSFGTDEDAREYFDSGDGTIHIDGAELTLNGRNVIRYAYMMGN